MNPIIMYENYLNGAEINVSSTDSNPNYNKANLYDYRPYTYWKADNSDEQAIEIIFPTAKSITAVAIIAHDLDGTILSLKKVVDEIETNIITWTQNGNGIILKTFSPQTATSFKLYMSNAGGKKIGVMMLGNYITFPFPPNKPYAPYEEAIVAENAITEGGYLLGTVIKYYPISINANFDYVPVTWVNTYFIPFWQFAKTLRPFIYAWNLSDYPNDVFYVWIKPDSIQKFEKSIKEYIDSITLSMVGV